MDWSFKKYIMDWNFVGIYSHILGISHSLDYSFLHQSNLAAHTSPNMTCQTSDSPLEQMSRHST